MSSMFNLLCDIPYRSPFSVLIPEDVTILRDFITYQKSADCKESLSVTVSKMENSSETKAIIKSWFRSQLQPHEVTTLAQISTYFGDFLEWIHNLSMSRSSSKNGGEGREIILSESVKTEMEKAKISESFLRVLPLTISYLSPGGELPSFKVKNMIPHIVTGCI